MHTTYISSIHPVGVFVGLALLFACGGSGDDTGSTTSPLTTSGDTSTSTPVTSGDTSTSTPVTSGDTSTSTPGTSTGDGTSTSSPVTTGVTSEGSEGTSTSSTGPSTESSSESASSSGGDEVSMTFFVSSTGSPTGNLGGLQGADERCQTLAEAVGAGDKTWHAYLSVEFGPIDQPIHAKDRIGTGPWYNADLVMIAADLAELHAPRDGDHELFLDENGAMVPGQWEGSPDPNEHDILTGTNPDGTVVPGKTCDDWTSESPMVFAQVGHSDGLGPMMNDAPMYRPWNSVHESGGCHDTAPKGGAGRVYCFAID